MIVSHWVCVHRSYSDRKEIHCILKSQANICYYAGTGILSYLWGNLDDESFSCFEALLISVPKPKLIYFLFPEVFSQSSSTYIFIYGTYIFKCHVCFTFFVLVLQIYLGLWLLLPFNYRLLLEKSISDFS